MAVSVVIDVLRETLQLQGARGLDLERASSGDISDDQGPEQRLNICLVSEVFVQILATGVGTLAFIWATVVLLGGFSTFLHKVDFWVITGMVFVQAAKVVGVNSNTEAKFFAQVPPAFLEYFTGRRRPLTGDASGWLLRYYIKLGLVSARDVISFMALVTSVLLLLPFVAASSCIGLSIFRLFTITRHKQYRDFGADNSTANVLRALIFFYALVLAQGGLVLIWLCILIQRTGLRNQVRSEYHLEAKLMDKYINRTSSACIKAGVLNTINRKLVSFAIDLLHSEYREDRISGVQVLHRLTTEYREDRSSGVQVLHRLTTDAKKNIHVDRAIAHIQSSPDCIARMLVLLSSKSGIDDTSRVNLALIVTKISKGVRLSDVDGATESLSSLIDPYLTKVSTLGGSVSNVSQQGISQPPNMQNGENNCPLITHGREILAKLVGCCVSNVSQQGISQQPNMQNGENNRPLIIHGLEILAKLAKKNPDNCAKIFSNKDLFPKIIAPISNKLYTVFTDDQSGSIAVEITEKSLQVVSKLVQGTHDINREIRHEICEKRLVVDIIHPILKLKQTRYNKLKVAAIKILSQLDLVNIVGHDAYAKVDYINGLMGLLVDESIIGIKKAAAKALVLLAADSTTHCRTIVNWSRGPSESQNTIEISQDQPVFNQQNVSVVEQLSGVLDDSDPTRRSSDPCYRNAVAQLLTHFCVHSTDAETMEHLQSILHKVLIVIIREVDDALGSENQQPNSQLQNRRPYEFVLQFCPPCVDTSLCAGRQGASDNGAPPGTPLQRLQALLPCLGTSSRPNQSGGGNTLQNLLNRLRILPSSALNLLNRLRIIPSSALNLLNRLVNMPGAYSNSSIGGDHAEAQLPSTPIEAGSRKTLVAFLGLALQICDKLSNAAGFNGAVAALVQSTHLSDRAGLVDRFEKIIAWCKTDADGLFKGRGPSADYLMMMKSATKLCAWIMRQNPSYIAHFLQKDMDKKLEGALEAMRGLELGVLLTYSADQLTNYETLSSIVENAKHAFYPTFHSHSYPHTSLRATNLYTRSHSY